MSEAKVDLHFSDPDYDFEAAYKLPGFKDLEKYWQRINICRMCSLQKKSGKLSINLNEMNVLLPAKVEELTFNFKMLTLELTAV